MATLYIPVTSDYPAYFFNITLEDKSYILNFKYNERLNRWIMDILNTDKTSIISGIILLTNIELTKQYSSNINLPPGKFIAIDTQGFGKNPERYELGVRVRLTYKTSV